ncbi:hypothetical protein BV898_14896 [Hypsibius exemplaris]|uniref:Peptidase M12A domain-containing protein n=1 Tax=Hypsibius exemplaris TaxID=2072580 RepID=A0A9X6RJW5_HYPEX|nr:hypothetical protein BV898_14896 [Hypsibius exemplaris]
MHYAKYDFAIDKTVWTIRPNEKHESAAFIGQRLTLSPTDIRKINLMYNCEDKDPGNEPEPISTPTTVTRISKTAGKTPESVANSNNGQGKEKLCISESYPIGQCDGDDEACVQSVQR